MKYAKPTKGQCNGKEQKPIFGSSSKVLCREQVWIMFINMFINLHKLLVLIFKSYWIHYFVTAHRVIELTTRDLLSSKVQIFRLKEYTFAIPITPDELHEAEVRLEGMLFHFLNRHFKTNALQKPTPLVSRD